MMLLAAINLRGVGESVKFNVVLTLIELTALAIVIGIGLWVMGRGDGDISRVTEFTSPGDVSALVAITVATAIAFFSMVGFEDSVNMVEECKDPRGVFPRAMLTGLGIAVVIYMLVAIAVVTVLTAEEITKGADSETGVLLAVVREGMPGLPREHDLPVPDGLRRRQHRAHQHAHGQPARLRHGQPAGAPQRRSARCCRARQSPWAAIAFTTGLALVLIVVVENLAESTVTALAGTTGLLLLCVFAVVNVAVIVLRRDPAPEGTFRAPKVTPFIAAVACLYLAGPWARLSDQMVQYKIAGGMLLVGVVLWGVTWVANKRENRSSEFKDVDNLGG